MSWVLLLVLALAALLLALPALSRREREAAREAGRHLAELRGRHAVLRRGLEAAAREAEALPDLPPKPARR